MPWRRRTRRHTVADMQVAGRPSWRFAYGNGQASDLHEALFARDAAGLIVPQLADVPPPLAAEWLAAVSSARLAEIAEGTRALAAVQWLTWWRKLIANKVRLVDSRPPPGDDMTATLAWAESLYESAVFDPPNFDSLVSAPELRRVVLAARQVRPRGLADRSGSFHQQPVRSIAEQTAEELGAPIEAMDARAHVLDVTGSWWHVAGPGCVLCSPAATADQAVAAQLLRAAFTSRLGRT